MQTGRIGPLTGTERAFFEDHSEELRTGYEAGVQGLVDAWEESSATVASLQRRSFRK